MFDFKDAQESKNTYLSPGVHTVKTTQIISDVAPKTGAPFIEWSIIDKAGLVSSNRFYLNTTVKEGSEKSAWDITKPAIVNVIAAINNISFEEAKAKLPSASSPAELSAELAKMTVNKAFDVRLNGKEIQGQNGKNNWIKAEFNFAKGTVAPAGSNSLTFDESKHVKRLVAPSTPGINTTGADMNW